MLSLKYRYRCTRYQKLMVVIHSELSWFLCLFTLCIVKECNSIREELRIGGLFDEEGYEQHLAFEHAVDYVNSERILPAHTLVADGRKVTPDNDFLVSKTVCDLFGTGVMAVFGPTTGSAADYVQSMCDSKEVPHIEFRSDVDQYRDALMINLYPYPPVLARAYVDIVRAWHWTTFTIFYDSFQGLPHVNELLKMYDTKGYVVNVRQLDETRSGNFRPALNDAKKAGETNFIIECDNGSLADILIQAQQVGLMSDTHNYIILNPDLHTLDLTPFQYGGANITGVSMIDPMDEDVIEVARDFHKYKQTVDRSIPDDRMPQFKFKSKIALLYDAVYVFAMALKDLNRAQLTAKLLSCDARDNWEHGYSLINFIKTKQLRGLTGEIKFDHQGFRSDFNLDVLELSERGLVKVGVWNSTEGLNITRPVLPSSDSNEENLTNRSFTVLISETEPYAMYRESSAKLTGNDRYEGFGIDLISELALLLGFKYTFLLHPDSNYGSYNKTTKEWNGMIRELRENRGDLAITDLTITAEREAGVDFTMPFMNLGISILYKKEMKIPPKLFSFISPFSSRVWIALGAAYVFTSVMLFIIGRISPAEWTNPYPCVEEPEYLYNQFNITNCFWMTMGCLMTQGSDACPIGISTRMLAGLWFFFVLILNSSYTANLTAFLAVESFYRPINSIEDLANQNTIKFGAKTRGATANFFRDSNYTTYKKIWQYMETHPEDMEANNPAGVNRADQTDYAFLMESTGILYTTERYCNLSQVGGLLDNKGYGIAMRKDSSYRGILSTAVLRLQESGRLAQLKNKWWKEKKGGGKCRDVQTSVGAAELSLRNLGGVFLVLVVGCSVVGVVKITGSPYDIRIGGIFDVDQEEQKLAFSHAVELVNNEKLLFPHRLVVLSDRVNEDNVYEVSKTVCSMLSSGVFSIFGPSSKSSSLHVQSICDTKEMPHVETMCNFHQHRGSCQVNIYPHPPVLARLFVDIVKSLKWKSFTIIYETGDSLPRISELLKLSGTKRYSITLKQLDSMYTGSYRTALKEVKNSGEINFIIDCSITILNEVLKQAMQVGLMSDLHSYLITNLDLHTIDLFPYKHGGANITGIQLVDPTDEKIISTARALHRLRLEARPDLEKVYRPELNFRVETALIYDAVYLFAKSLKQLKISKSLNLKQLFCNDTNSWEHGYSIINYMKTNSIKGLTGDVKFDYQGFRSDFALNIIELNASRLIKIGTWNASEGLNITRSPHDDNNNRNDEPEEEFSLRNHSFIVLIALTDPYGMLKEASDKLIGNDRFEGYGIDLIHELSLMLRFNYTFKVQEDGNYGTKNLTTGEWNGMIRELRDNRADLAITDLTITSEREEAADFTSPFMNLGISILYKKPMKLAPSLFSFLSPFSKAIWYYLGCSYVGVSLMLFIMARLSPAEWTNRFPCVDEPVFLENQFSFRNCFWFTLGSLMQQGSELAPIATSTRMVAGIWWFFILIMVSTYTANLAAFLTVESLSSPFKSIEELANQDVIKYGAKRGGATHNFFRNSTYATYKKIWKFMEEHPDVMTASNPEGVRRAEMDNYAFLMESTTIEYTTERHCNLTRIGRLLDDKGYGIAMRKNMSYRHALTTSVLKLQETGKLRELRRKWWKEKRGAGFCTNAVANSDIAELGLPNLGGVFLVLGVGSIVGFLIGVMEMLLNAANVAFKKRTTFKEELDEDLKTIFSFRSQTKTVRYRKSRINSKQTFQEFDYPQQTFSYAPDLTK
ncbi:Kainate-type ionotropic glutamate receptor subunit 1D [Carabus blaptoides fortunei]